MKAITTTIGAVLVLTAASQACAQKKAEASLTLVGHGKQPVVVRDADGEVTEMINQSHLNLMNLPEDIAKREAEFRQQRLERAKEIAARREQERQAEAERSKAAAAGNENASAGDAGDSPNTPKAEAQAASSSAPAEPQLVASEPVDPQLRTPTNTGVRQVTPPPPPRKR